MPQRGLLTGQRKFDLEVDDAACYYRLAEPPVQGLRQVMAMRSSFRASTGSPAKRSGTR